jgi:hypothetical protein
MARQIYDVTLRLNDGAVRQGRGRNLQATIEKMYHDVRPQAQSHHITRLDHIDAAETGYAGTYNVYFSRGYEQGRQPDATATVAVPSAAAAG